MDEVLVFVEFLGDYGKWKKGDFAPIPAKEALELYKQGLVRFSDLSRDVVKLISTMDAIIQHGKQRAPLSIKVERSLYREVETYLWLLENIITAPQANTIDSLQAYVQRYSSLKNWYEKFRAHRFKVIVDAARLRPNSMQILGRLADEERLVYMLLSAVYLAFTQGSLSADRIISAVEEVISTWRKGGGLDGGATD
ncbi:hypothetical protein [Pyrococcus kukulkanii]|uniref:hypothetical protein n=1 Tax=Pyrococcus kukulkanii TaxID=1609559 RepID=UPI0035612BA6